MISGEAIQELCDVYCGIPEDFDYNLRIALQTVKHIHLDKLHMPWKNPRRIFCYTHRLDTFMQILPCLENDFVLVTHNSDGNITEKYRSLLDHPKLLFWHAQNVLFNHPKLGGLPIGIANSMWPHGNQEVIESVIADLPQKTESIYFNFSLSTNPQERSPCYEALKGRLTWQPTLDFKSYIQTLANYKYAICPPGNGIDCHRIWECIYLGVIPILLKSSFTEKVNIRFPCILLDTWEDLDVEKLLQLYIPPQYKLSMNHIEECVQSMVKFL